MHRKFLTKFVTAQVISLKDIDISPTSKAVFGAIIGF